MGLDDRKGDARQAFGAAKREQLSKSERQEAFEAARKQFMNEQQARANPGLHDGPPPPTGAAGVKKQSAERRMRDLYQAKQQERVSERAQAFTRAREQLQDRSRDR